MSHEKFKAWFLNKGSKSECQNWRKKNLEHPRKLKYHIWKYYISKKFDFCLFMQFMGILKQKFAISRRKSVIRKNFTVQESLQKSFYSILDGQKNFWFFCFFFLLWHPLHFDFFSTLLSLFLHTFWVTSQSDHKSGPLSFS